MKKSLLLFLTLLMPIILLAQIYPMDGTPINTCTGLFLDSGGISDDYSPNEDITTTICPTTAGTLIGLSFQNSLLGAGDTLCFYDGDSVGAPALTCIDEASGSVYNIQATSANTGGCITVTFKSDGANDTGGWTGAISCIIPCQNFTAQILSTVPAVFPADTGYIDLCMGESVLLSGTADFYQNNIYYSQDNASSIFEWRLGDGTILEGEEVSHAYQEPGGYHVKLSITDVNGCKSENILTQRIRVTGLDDFNVETDHELGSCEGDTVVLISSPAVINNFAFQDALLNVTNLPIPDGTGASYTSEILVDQFPQGSAINNPSDFVKICMNIEHSWMHDLEIQLICPSGNSVVLQAQVFEGEIFLGEPFEADEGMTVVPGIGYDYCFSDNALNGTFTEHYLNTEVETLPAGEYSSFEDLSNLLGCPLNGEWELRVTDLWGIDNGFLFSWSLEFAEALSSNDETFTVDVTNQGWLANPSILSNSGDTIIAQIDAAQSFTYQVDFDNGCSVDTTLEITPVSNNTLACSDCNDLVVDAGEDVSFDCINPVVILNAGNSSNGDYFEYEWTTSDGQILGSNNGLEATVTNSGTYVFTLTSLLTGCTLLDSVMVLPTQNTPIANAGEDIPFPCDAGEVTLDGTNSTVGTDFVFQWTAESGQIVSGANTLNPVISEPGIYLLQVDNTMNGCSALDTIIVEDQVINDVLIVDATCDNADGAITLLIPSGTSNPVFSWSNGQTGAIAQNLEKGWYSVTVTYDDDCSVHENIFVDESLSCKVQIIGRVVNDNLLPDCTEDGSSDREEAIMLHLMPEDVYTYTNYNGVYEFVTDNGDHTVEVLFPPYLENLCPSNGIIDVSLPVNGTSSTDNDFYLEYVPGAFDLSVSCFMGIARPGMGHVYNIEYCNEGDVAKSGTITFVHDSEEDNIFTVPFPQDWSYDEANSTATWTFTDLQPGDCLMQQVVLEIPPTAVVGTVLSGSLEVSSEEVDFDPSNDFKSWNQMIVASFDPNDKQVFVASSESQFGGMIYESDTTLFYQIRFQNTGTDTAFTVVIQDTLDVALDVTTIRPGTSSHPYSLEFDGHNVLIFNFENILLPDSTTDLAASQGYVTFSIDRKLGLPLGTTIANNAAIYFDYNTPVITNEVVNVLSEFVSVVNIENKKPTVQISPNPNKGEFTIFYKLKETSDIHFTIFDIHGKALVEIGKREYQIAGNHTNDLSIKELPNGIYFLRLSTPYGSVIKRIIKLD